MKYIKMMIWAIRFIIAYGIRCGASFWLNESLKYHLKNHPPTFTLCCQKHKIVLPLSPPTPEFLENLLNPVNGHRSKLFRLNFRGYNCMLAFTSFGGKIDNLINYGSAPYVFKISVQVHHLMGSLLPPTVILLNLPNYTLMIHNMK